MDRIIRPKMEVLPDSALVAATHVVAAEQPFFMKKPGKKVEADGVLAAGTAVSLISEGPGEWCLVQDAADRKVYTAREGLQPVTEADCNPPAG